MAIVGEATGMALDPSEYTVRELRDEVLDDVDDVEALEAALEAEREGQDRSTAIDHIEARLDAVAEKTGNGEGEEELPDFEEVLEAEEAEEEIEVEPVHAAPASESTTTVIFDTMGAGGGRTGHNTIHRVDDDLEPACGARVGAKGQRGPRHRFDADAEDCSSCWG